MVRPGVVGVSQLAKLVSGLKDVWTVDNVWDLFMEWSVCFGTSLNRSGSCFKHVAVVIMRVAFSSSGPWRQTGFWWDE